MRITVKAYLRQDQEGNLVYIVYRYKNKTFKFSTGERVNPHNWTGENGGELRGKSTAKTNARIQQLKEQIRSIALELERLGEQPTTAKVKAKFLKEPELNEPVAVKDWVYYLEAKYLPAIKNDVHPRTYQTKSYCFEDVKKFAKKKRFELVELTDFNNEFFDQFRNYLYWLGNTDNTIKKKFRIVKAFLNKMKSYGYPIDPYINNGLSTEDKPKPIVFLTKPELKALAKVEASPREKLARDYFLIQCLTGLRVSDVKRLGKKHITDGFIIIKPEKTKKNSERVATVYINAEVRAILERYNYELPYIPPSDVNELIKDLLERAEVKTPVEIPIYKGAKTEFKTFPKYQIIGTHNAVKTFITLSLQSGADLATVASITGKSIKTIRKHYYGTTRDEIKRQMSKVSFLS